MKQFFTMDLDKLILTVICIDQWDGKRKSCKGGRWEKKSHILTSCCSFSVAEHLITCMWWLLLMKHIRTQHPDRKPFTWQRIHNKKSQIKSHCLQCWWHCYDSMRRWSVTRQAILRNFGCIWLCQTMLWLYLCFNIKRVLFLFRPLPPN